MKQIDSVMSKLFRGRTRYAVFVLCVAMAIALPGQTFTTLFSVGGADGYGTTTFGGANRVIQASLGDGTIFKITPSGMLTMLYSFCSQPDCGDAGDPQSALVQDTNGTFYGTTDVGGANGSGGTAFSLAVGLGPFVEAQTTSGEVGAAVEILGTDLTGATRISFNGTVAVFTVVSASLITTTVPAGATTGKVRVVAPSGTLSSNVAFDVGP